MHLTLKIGSSTGEYAECSVINKNTGKSYHMHGPESLESLWNDGSISTDGETFKANEPQFELTNEEKLLDLGIVSRKKIYLWAIK